MSRDHSQSDPLPNHSYASEDEEERDVHRTTDDEQKAREECTAVTTDCSSSEAEEKAHLISQILELQSTLEDLSRRVESVTEENMKFKSENQVLAQYIENLMASSNTFQNASKQKAKEMS
jgi:uncharacterized protein (DUF3084 family)